jgi:hypothetical protein
MTRQVAVAELQNGDIVLDDDEPSFEVHGVEQHQGQVQVADITGATHTYPAGATVVVR